MGKSGPTRPLEIPSMMDRTVQTLYNFVLDVHQEDNASPLNFGFRKGRNAAQALTYAHQLCSGSGKRWIMKIDIQDAYDTVSHR
jgi:retron-type reverse transcriptase